MSWILSWAATSGDRLIQRGCNPSAENKITAPCYRHHYTESTRSRSLVGRTLKSEMKITNVPAVGSGKELGVKNVVIKGGHLAKVASD